MVAFHRAAFVAFTLSISALALATDPTMPTTPAPTTPSSTPPPATPPSTTMPSTSATAKPVENLSDAQIASLLVAINQSEIDEGKMMASKATNADVKKFAQQMVDDHTTMLNGVQAWQKKTSSAASATSQTLTDMQNEVKTEMTDLGKLSGAALDKKYIDGAVTGHQKVLDMMDHGLIDQADDADLKTAIRDARTKVAAHLDAAKKLQMTAGTHPAQVGTPSSTTASNGK